MKELYEIIFVTLLLFLLRYSRKMTDKYVFRKAR
jgi:hypothetical protein